jgi:hypothetical protein
MCKWSTRVNAFEFLFFWDNTVLCLSTNTWALCNFLQFSSFPSIDQRHQVFYISLKDAWCAWQHQIPVYYLNTGQSNNWIYHIVTHLCMTTLNTCLLFEYWTKKYLNICAWQQQKPVYYLNTGQSNIWIYHIVTHLCMTTLNTCLLFEYWTKVIFEFITLWLI